MEDQMVPRFYVKNGLRKVVPYFDINKTNAKGHWFGRRVIDLLSGEFKSRSIDYYYSQIHKKHVLLHRKGCTLSGDMVADTIIQAHDVLEMYGHRHEAPVVYQEKIPVIFEDERMIVIDKPSSIPTHPTGRYIYNSATELMKLQEGLEQLYPAYRLDRLTSGVLILAKTSDFSGEMHGKTREKGVTKNYIARVQGKFPDEVICDRPVFVIEPSKGYISGITPKREAVTHFSRLKYNQELDQSVVLCQPKTGRTHQIRIHLNFLGHAIVNDPLYGPSASKIRHRLMNTVGEIKEEDFFLLAKEYRSVFETLKVDQVCEECQTVDYEDPKAESLIMWLHAIKYSSGDGEWSFETEMPSWARDL